MERRVRFTGAMKIGAIMVGATAMGLACGSSGKKIPVTPLPEAGSARDDGSGILARTSGGKIKLGPQEDENGGNTYADYYQEPYYDPYYSNPYYYDPYYGGGYYYGGSFYGNSNASGGALYANYQFNWNSVPAGSTGTVPPTDYIGTEVTTAGSISGTVTWASPPAAAESIPSSVAGCSAQLDNPTLQIDSRSRVGNVVVYLSDIKSGKHMPTLNPYVQLGGSLEQHDCALSPHIQLIAPAGSPLKITNSDDESRTFTGRLWDNTEQRPDEAFELTLRGNAATKKTATNYYGFLRVVTSKPKLASSAWAIVAPHPYYVITDDQGGFRLDDVPAGTYRLTVWHEPVILGVDEAGELVLSEPVIQTQKVTVRAQVETRTTVKLKKL